MLPFSSYTRVIPIFLPSSAGVMVRSVVKYTVKYTTRDACPFLPRGAGSWMNPTVREEKCPLRQGHVFSLKKGQALIFTNTPAGTTRRLRASTVRAVGSKISITRLCVRISNCSRDFLSMCGLRSTVYRSTRVGMGMGPQTRALVRLAWSTISFADASSARWSYASIRILIRSPVMSVLFPIQPTSQRLHCCNQRRQPPVRRTDLQAVTQPTEPVTPEGRGRLSEKPGLSREGEWNATRGRGSRSSRVGWG